MSPRENEAPAPYAAPRLLRYGSILELTAADWPAGGPGDGAAKLVGGKIFQLKSL
jgi:hypothetical protein